LRENLIFTHDEVFSRMVNSLLKNSDFHKPIAVWDGDTVSESEFGELSGIHKISDFARVAAVSFNAALLYRIKDSHVGIITAIRPFPLNFFEVAFDRTDMDENSDIIRVKISADIPVIDRENASVKINSKIVKLTSKEFELFEMLYAQKGEIVPREKIDELFGEGGAGNTADVYIHYLRKKIGKTTITSVRGKGYRMCREWS